MSNSLKVTLYAVLVLIASVSGYFAFSSLGRMMSRAGDRTSALEQIEPERRPATEAAETNSAAAPETNALAAVRTNQLATNTVSAQATNTNALAAALAPSSADEVKPPPREEAPPRALGSSSSNAGKKSSHMGMWLGLFIVSLLALGLLLANDVSHFIGNRALKVMYNDEGEGVKDPEYDKAEEVWARGDHLEAIRMMREYLAQNPREQHVAIRIAEIYEKDLKNNLAAALEYEEVLKQKLPAERWGWAAIHLCNLYFRLNQEQKGFALLRRIVSEYPNTGAAEKARKRLEESGETPPAPAAAGEAQAGSAGANPPAAASNLPPGFRPKK